MQRWIAAACLLFASSAFASFNPLLTPSIVTLRPGETATLALSAWWSGIAPLPAHVVLVSDTPDVAEANGSLTWDGAVSDPLVLDPVKVKALTPGVAHVVDLGLRRPYATIVVACDSPGTGIAFPLQERVTVPQAQNVKLEIGTAGFDDPSFAWYDGDTGDFRVPSPGHASSSDRVFYAPGLFHVWAEAWDRCNYATIEFTIEVLGPPPNRRRAARH
ncbi:MAG TPA: hypothetical protein VGJ81_14785 [Thermoanaerobaculia bacterium]|jgi:hypothetical protein